MPEPTTFDEAVYAVAAQIAKLVIARHHKYGPENIAETGLLGIGVRLSDKAARLRNLARLRELSHGSEPDVSEAADESAFDTLADAAGYGIMGTLEMRGWLQLPLEASDIDHD